MASTPSPPNPVTTAQAQTASNIATANATQETNDVNQNTPYGSLTYTQNGTNPDGTANVTANTSLSPQIQNLENSNIAGAQTESNTENQLLGNVSSSLAQPVNLGESADEQRLDQLAVGSVAPQQQQATASQQQQLYDQGLRPGDEAYNNATGNLAQQQNQQLNDLYLQGHTTATSDALQQQNEPLNELSALRSGSQVSQPSIGATSTPTTSVAGTNTAGIAQQDYADQLSASNAAMGGLFGLGGTLGGAAIKAFA